MVDVPQRRERFEITACKYIYCQQGSLCVQQKKQKSQLGGEINNTRGKKKVIRSSGNEGEFGGENYTGERGWSRGK